MKLSKIVAAATLALVLTGCSTNQSKQTKNYQSDSKTQLNSKAPSSSSKSDNHFMSLTQQLSKKFNNTLLPQTSGLTNDHTVNAKETGNSNNLKIVYTLDNHALPLNSNKISNNTYATLTKKTYTNSSAAKESINFQPASSTEGLPKINLGHSITGRTQSGAGQEYISWNEGRWSISVHGSRVNHTNPKFTAVSAVNMFEKYSLPAPETLGTVALFAGDTTGLNQTITFQKGSVVYTLKANSASAGIKMAASMK
ncbi:hypothetical protein [Lentilactobacillus sp. SPB1-3]|uniref:Uncharacterized protein n=1 Tax=Lentilactobacillus terminaliae TaxID=3003483 RepID=A0ACD5DDX6_9LACO|nr:hypothetical protein [Lentilactobacillus sp. SPB1-3]MCZ0977761.1 hypothetical protein [Lentilactobacillus sp. SPB1-3]